MPDGMTNKGTGNGKSGDNQRECRRGTRYARGMVTKKLVRPLFVFCVAFSICVLGRGLATKDGETGKQVTWRFDQTAALGGHGTKILGHPQVIETPMGKAIAFNGVDDALFVDVHPLAGAEIATWRPLYVDDQEKAHNGGRDVDQRIYGAAGSYPDGGGKEDRAATQAHQ